MLVTCSVTTAGAQTPPTTSSSFNDFSTYAQALATNHSGVGAVVTDNAADVVLTDPTIVPCPAIQALGGGNYYVNGYDQLGYVLAKPAGTTDMYLAIKVAGVIGDTDGDGNPDLANSSASCNPGDNVIDGQGIAAGETYQFQFDTNCAGSDPTQLRCARPFGGGSSTLTITNNQIIGSGLLAGVTGTFGSSGGDLVIVLHNVNLPSAFKVRTFVGSNTDGLSEDTAPVFCAQPNPSITLDKTIDPVRVCIGKTTKVTLTMHNTGDVDLTNVVLEDDLPPGITFAGNVGGTCGAGAPQVNGSAVVFPAVNLAFGASCTVTFDVLAGAECIGTETNNAHVTAGIAAAGCLDPGPPIGAQASFQLTCVGLPCLNLNTDAPSPACANATVHISGSVSSCSTEAEQIVVTVNGQQAFNAQVAAGSNANCGIDLNMGACTPGANVAFAVHATATGECEPVATKDATVNVPCAAGPCVQAGALCDAGNGATAACPGTPITVTGSGTNCSTAVEDITVTIEGQSQTFQAVPVGQTVSWSRVIPMPTCTSGQQVAFNVSATASNTCGTTKPSNASCNITCQTPDVQISKVADPAGAVDMGTTLHYTITVTNPSKTVGLDNVVVTDDLCQYETFQGNSTPATASAPAVGSTGQIKWNLGSIPANGSSTITFDAAIVTLASPACQATDLACDNKVSVDGNCADATAHADGHYNTPINPCVQTSLCRLTGGGCLNENGDNKGHKQSTFGGNSSPAHTGGGPTGNEWEHVYRDGRTILFNWHSHDAHVVACTDVTPGPCHPKGTVTRADFEGTGLYSIGAGGRDQAGNMVAYIIDHTEGACNKNVGDYYSIIVRDGLTIGSGTVVFQTEGTIDCGNLQIHQTPASLFGAGLQPGASLATSSVALLNKAYPNPFSGSTTFAYKVATAGTSVDVGVYNVAGRLVKSLDSGVKTDGTYTLSWNGTDGAGMKMAPGVYFLRSRVGAESSVERVIYLSR